MKNVFTKSITVLMLLMVLSLSVNGATNNAVQATGAESVLERAEGHPTGFSTIQLVKSTITIVLILSLLIGINVYLKKRAGQLKGFAGTRIRIIEKQNLDARKALMLVEVEDRRILIGVAPQQIVNLGELAPEEDVSGENG